MQEVSSSTESKRSRFDSAMYSMSDVAGLFNIGYTTLWNAVHEGTFPVKAVKVGRVWRFPKSHVDRVLGLTTADPDAA